MPEVLAERGRWRRAGYDDVAGALGIDRFTRCVGMDARTMVTFDSTAGDPLELRSFVQQELVRRGVLWSGSHNVSDAHGSEEVSFLLEAYEEVLPLLRDAVESGRVRSLLRGKPVEPVFRRTSHFDLKPKTRA